MLKNKAPLSKITPQYIIDKAGKKTGVILDILAFERLLEEIEDIYFGSIAHKALQEEDEYVTHADVKKKIARKREQQICISAIGHRRDIYNLMSN